MTAKATITLSLLARGLLRACRLSCPEAENLHCSVSIRILVQLLVRLPGSLQLAALWPFPSLPYQPAG